MKTLRDIKKGDIVKLLIDKKSYIVPVIRETISFLECDLKGINEQNKMMFSRQYGLQKGAFKQKNWYAPKIQVIED